MPANAPFCPLSPFCTSVAASALGNLLPLKLLNVSLWRSLLACCKLSLFPAIMFISAARWTQKLQSSGELKNLLGALNNRHCFAFATWYLHLLVPCFLPSLPSLVFLSLFPGWSKSVPTTSSTWHFQRQDLMSHGNTWGNCLYNLVSATCELVMQSSDSLMGL